MALSNYTELQASVAAWLSRSDLTALVPDFIALAEADIRTDLRLLPTVTTLTTVPGQDYIDLPADWLEFVYLKFDGEPLEYTPPDILRSENMHSGAWRKYSIEGRRLLLSHEASTADTIDVSYHARLDALATTATNWLLTDQPNVYLWRSLYYALIYLQDDARAEGFAQRYMAEVEKLPRSEAKGRSSGSPLRIRTR